MSDRWILFIKPNHVKWIRSVAKTNSVLTLCDVNVSRFTQNPAKIRILKKPERTSCETPFAIRCGSSYHANYYYMSLCHCIVHGQLTCFRALVYSVLVHKFGHRYRSGSLDSEGTNIWRSIYNKNIHNSCEDGVVLEQSIPITLWITFRRIFQIRISTNLWPRSNIFTERNMSTLIAKPCYNSTYNK